MTHSLSNVPRFFRIERLRLSFTDSAESAMASANVSAQHKCRRAIRPAFENVRALRFLTDCVEIQSLNQLQQMVLIRGVAKTNLEPIGFWLTRCGVENSKFAGQGSYLNLSLQKHSSIRVSDSASKHQSCAILRRIWMTRRRCTRMDTDQNSFPICKENQCLSVADIERRTL